MKQTTFPVRKKPTTIIELLSLVRFQKASDLHLSGGLPPTLRIGGAMRSGDCSPFNPKEVEQLLDQILSTRHKEILRERMSVDLGIEIAEVGRFRVAVYFQRGLMTAAFRILADGMPSFTSLGLPESLSGLPKLRDGLVLITGATGSGKSTTLATIINEINRTSERTIITIEDPIEYMHGNLNSIVFQRELHTDVPSFASAMRDALRSDPDVILVGEMRDLETIRTAITAAETGHLVLSTLHSRDATSSVNRIVGAFPAGEQGQIRQQLSTSLRAVVSQRLLPGHVGGGRVPAVEIMFINTGIANLIRQAKDEMIYSAIETGLREGMQTMEQSLIRLVHNGHITMETALQAARRPDLLKQRLCIAGNL
nr:PilT/PilU family type 4a pilus ATPase [uncultured Desulfuromonas sp.]